MQEWKMNDNVRSYLDEAYRDNILAQIKLSSGDPVLDIRNMFPYSQDDRLSDKERKEKIKNTAGYTYPYDDKLYIKDLDKLGISQEDAFQDKLNTTLSREKFNTLSPSKQLKIKSAEFDRKNTMDQNTSRVGTHEALHNVLGMYYPNAHAEMLKGTSELGVPQNKTGYLHPTKRIVYTNPETGKKESRPKRYKSSDYEQDELLTQALTGLIENNNYDWNTNQNYMLYQNMDRPAQGPLGAEGMQKFLIKQTKPFYSQLQKDAEVGYIQDSVWSKK